MSESEKPWYLPLLVSFLNDEVPALLGISPAACARDIITLEYRVCHEGESFLTKTLPTFGKVFDLALQGRCAFTVPGFKSISRSRSLPAFLQAVTTLIFQDDGTLWNEPNLKAITAVRQIAYWFKKVEKGFTDESLQQSLVEFINIDQNLPEVSISSDTHLLVLARSVCEKLLAGYNPASRLTFGHGPGAVASCKGEPALVKRRFKVSYRSLEAVFRPIPTFFSLRDAAEDYEIVTRRLELIYGLSRLAFVEKDSSGPRLIGLEPPEYMWCQQALKRGLYHHIEEVSELRGQINFTDQGVNRALTALWAKYDTLDMSKASDRNSLALVRVLLGRTQVWPYLLASRTPGVTLPDGSTLLYKKFAPMGSAVCFPVEAIVFYALAVAALHLEGYPLSLAQKNVFVYGDDLIVPHGFYAALASRFEPLGLLFSENKCCISGKFRESCGMDSYDGTDVTPLRLRRITDEDPTSLISLVQHANQLMIRGYWSTSRVLRQLLRKRFAKIRALRLPVYNTLIPSVLHFLDFERGREPRVKQRLYKGRPTWITYVNGWVFVPNKVRARDMDEQFYMRESLSSHGPVGSMQPEKRSVEVEAAQCGRALSRFFTKRWSGTLHKRRVNYPTPDARYPDLAPK